jgi:hypothetical protein
MRLSTLRITLGSVGAALNARPATLAATQAADCIRRCRTVPVPAPWTAPRAKAISPAGCARTHARAVWSASRGGIPGRMRTDDARFRNGSWRIVRGCAAMIYDGMGSCLAASLAVVRTLPCRLVPLALVGASAGSGGGSPLPTLWAPRPTR